MTEAIEHIRAMRQAQIAHLHAVHKGEIMEYEPIDYAKLRLDNLRKQWDEEEALRRTMQEAEIHVLTDFGATKRRNRQDWDAGTVLYDQPKDAA